MKTDLTNKKIVVYNLQTYLQGLSYMHSDIPKIIPDGIYNDETVQTVKSFQKLFNLPVTGVVDSRTWNLIYEEYKKYENKNSISNCIQPFPSDYSYSILKKGDKYDLVYIIQVMLSAITIAYNTIGSVNITGEYDEQTEGVIKNFQKISNLPNTGSVDKDTWNVLATAYNKYVRYDIN